MTTKFVARHLGAYGFVTVGLVFILGITMIGHTYPVTAPIVMYALMSISETMDAVKAAVPSRLLAAYK